MTTPYEIYLYLYALECSNINSIWHLEDRN